jgi:heat shock protein HslJ
MTLLIIVSCSHNTQKEEVKTPKTVINQDYNYENRFHKNKTNTEWQGTYKGLLPCPDCMGVETFLTVNNDETYKLKFKYLGRSNDYIELKGNFSWNAEGDRIILNDIKNAPNQYQLGDNQLIQLDTNGNQITGNLQEEYVFNKEQTSESNQNYQQLVDKKWRLVEIKGEPVPPTTKEESPSEVTFISKVSMMDGNGGCNIFKGSFEVTTNNRIFFGKINKSQNYCTRKDIEGKFMNVFDLIDTFEIIDNTLIFRKGKSTPIAKFVLVK